MIDQIYHRLGSEVLTESALHNTSWPLADPSKVEQKVLAWSETDSRLLDEAIANVDFDFERFRASVADLPPVEQIWRLLTHRCFNFNGVQRVRAETFWLDKIRRAVAAAEPVIIAYPLVCKIDQPAKRMTTVNVTAGEIAMIRFFRELGRAVRQFYPPGLVVRILSDATLYNSALQTPPPSAYAYMDEVRRALAPEGAAPFVELLDYSAILAPFYRRFDELYTRHYRRLLQCAAVEDVGSLPTSVRASINTRRFGLAYSQLAELFGPRQIAFSRIRLEIDTLTLHALREQLAIKMACDELDLPGTIWPNALRASCHKGLKSGRAVIGLRMYPEYYGVSRLLPYHGMPLIEPDSRRRPRLLILPEICLRGDGALTRVVNSDSDPVLYRRM